MWPWYAQRMLAKLTLMKPLVVAGAVAAAPAASADAFVAGPAANTPAPTHVIFKADPSGGGCDANGNCGSGGTNNGPGGQGCVPGVGCGSGGQNAGPAASPAARGACRAWAAVRATRKPSTLRLPGAWLSRPGSLRGR